MDGRGLKLLRQMSEGWSDVFGNQVGSRRSLLDIGSHYPISPERWRLFVDGTRQFIQYTDAVQYAHPEDTHNLSPNAGETVALVTADDVVYTVQFELAATWAFGLSQALQSGDRLRVGLFDDADGWFMEQTAAHATDEADFVIRRAGTEVYRETHPIDLPTTTFGRLGLETAWYRVARQRWSRSYPENGTQQNEVVATTDATPNQGPARGNLPLRYEITAGSSTTDLTLKAGSVAATLQGDSERIIRAKNYRETFSVNTTGTYVPVLAFRKDPDRDLVRMEITNTDVPKFEGSGDLFALLIAAGKENVRDANGDPLDDTDFSTPNELNGTNSVIETATAVAQFPDNTGTLVTSATNPGGYQLGLATRYTSGSGGKISSTGAGIDAKRVLASGDYAVLLVRATATGDFDYEVTIDQDW